MSTDSIVKRGPWPRSKVVLPPPPYTAADLSLLYVKYGKEAVDEALRIKEMYD